MFNVCLLGCGGTMPLPGRYLTSLLAAYRGSMILIDSGEGTQVTMKELGWGFKSIEAIFFTHYHADHIAGLPGLMLAIGNAGRVEPLMLAGPPGLKTIVQGLLVIAPYLPFSIEYRELSIREQSCVTVGDIHVHTLPVSHTTPCLAYKLEITRMRKFNPDLAKSLEIPVYLWKPLQTGNKVVYNGRTIHPDMVLGPARRGIKVCYCTDTRPIEGLVEFVKEADLFICEGMYGEQEKLPNAIEHGHMLFSEAAYLAREGEVRELWLTHYSPSIADPEPYMETVQGIFPNSLAGSNRLVARLTYRDEPLS
ncbi:ribonuclease Z [Aneurinibacillus sp. Ricciae_BoGa-3]|uniref:ribonuclease Z n=1 Tax=Aneurinibacillus sp. Ricciae_BoGa-3 TaxID=3022697 RepID=UPI002340C08E|nr:ribonuclease Z [Aneurinibacillus sp. Ricciae_BoGa-3]WCK54424.1 ribonuclease Z [Aneurinibacillus sp. Ricciae_BoGa-3]